MTPILQTLLTSFIGILMCMLALWMVGTLRQDVSLVDIFWGLGYVLVVGLACLTNAPNTERASWLFWLTTIWGVRLSLYLLWRNWGKPEDRRYAAMREYHGPRFWWLSLFTIFLLQGVILWFISLPLQVTVAMQRSTAMSWLDGFGILLWSAGFIFESIGDWQMMHFKSDPKNSGRVMDRGLWRFTRHPNYFGDFCVWWGIYLLAIAGGAGWTVASPLFMSWLLMRVSGVPMLEQTILDRRPDYAAYQTRTNAFFPGSPKRSK